MPAVHHRAHRPPATIPARRGMRASWFRGRAPHELEDELTGAGRTAPDDTALDPAEEAAALPPAAPAAPAPATAPAARAGFGHPTF